MSAKDVGDRHTGMSQDYVRGVGMAKGIDEEVGKRHRITSQFGNCYFFVAEKAIMLTVAEENSPQHNQLRALTEFGCRIATKAMGEGVPRSVIAEQMRKADAGRCKILSDMAECIEASV